MPNDNIFLGDIRVLREKMFGEWKEKRAGKRGKLETALFMIIIK